MYISRGVDVPERVRIYMYVGDWMLRAGMKYDFIGAKRADGMVNIPVLILGWTQSGSHSFLL